MFPNTVSCIKSWISELCTSSGHSQSRSRVSPTTLAKVSSLPHSSSSLLEQIPSSQIRTCTPSSRTRIHSKMSAFVPTTGMAAISGTKLAQTSPRRPQTPQTTHTRMVAYPYTGSGYGGAGIPYGGDRHGQSFKQTTTDDIVTTAASLPIFNTLVSLLQETGLDYELAKGGPFTVFAPTDTAFASLLEPHGFTTLAPLLRPENREELRRVLAYHVVKGDVSSGAVVAAGKIVGETLAGVTIPIFGYGKKVSAGSGLVVKADVPCTNGVIHVINTVLIPPTFEPQPAGPVKHQFVISQVQEVYGKMLTPRQALGIDPLPASADSTAITKQ